ncbi:hypothetical protein [Pseudidiomarina halophila]|uniref:hypothetical protein n=1 Tax=Pseudidiomarina halophila TaxID=1449799 RepID=UPI00361D54E7
MVRFNTVTRLLAFPLLWFSAIQAVFASLSVVVFADGVATVFFASSAASPF